MLFVDFRKFLKTLLCKLYLFKFLRAEYFEIRKTVLLSAFRMQN